MTPREMPAPETDFAAWRRQVGMTYDQAAEALHVSPSHVKNWEIGINRSRGNKAEPPHAVRVLMTAIAEGVDLEPWPGKKKRKAKG
jgi:DNA-binding transcriptional regulator YiaG